MPRRSRKSSTSHSLTPGQSSYVLRKLMAERKVSARDVQRYLGDMGREIQELEDRLAMLRESQAARQGSPVRRRPGRPSQAKTLEQPAPRRGRRRRQNKEVSPETMKSRQTQGQYLALIRQVTPDRRARYKAVAIKQGREAAIAQMRKDLKK